LDDEANSMTHSPEYFAEPPASGLFSRPAEPDALSEILHTVRLRVHNVIRCAPSSPFRISVPQRLRVLHIAETSGLHLSVGDRDISLQAGDMVLLARGEHHTISAGGPSEPRELIEEDLLNGGDDEGGAAQRWISGIFAVEDDVADPLLSVLPPAVVVPGARPGRQWQELGVHVVLDEITTPSPGSWVMLSRLLDLLFIRALRQWSATTDAEPGWLTAAMDTSLAPVLTAIHNNPEYPWSVTELAQRAGLSRSAFAERFTRLLGQSPAAYITDRRLDRAAQLLRSTQTTVSKIGHAVGYTSDAAFSRAFRRRFDQPPTRWRKTHAHTPRPADSTS
jgi:AraC-like DNA-binding protein